ncbi:MAG: hypothetical protein KL787_08820 [Taibaiella sp.]|nr:hypothetical protein [Taibaiella sp.]
MKIWVPSLPGYMDSTNIFGINTSSLAPGLFAFGYQPSRSWLEQEAELKQELPRILYSTAHSSNNMHRPTISMRA